MTDRGLKPEDSMLVIDDIIKLLKANKKASQLKALERDAKAAVESAQRLYGDGQGAAKKAHALKYLTDKGYKPEEDMLDALIEASVYQMWQNAPQRKKPPKAAQTAEEFREKYGRKRFTSSNAWRVVLYNYIYAAYQIDGGAKTGEIELLYDGSLKRGNTRSTNEIVAKISTTEDMLRYNSFVHLTEWTENAFKTAVFMRNALRSVVADYGNIASTIIAAEELSKALGSKAEEPQVSIWLSTLTIDYYAPQTHGGSIIALRRNIALALRYLKAYNTFNDMVAAAVDIPEYAIFRVDMNGTNEILLKLNDALSALVSLINERESTNDEYLEETLKTFEPIEIEPEPIPEKNIEKADAIISTLCRQGYKTWTSAFNALYAGYWRQA